MPRKFPRNLSPAKIKENKVFDGFYVRLFALDCMRDLYKDNISTDLEFRRNSIKYYFSELGYVTR